MRTERFQDLIASILASAKGPGLRITLIEDNVRAYLKSRDIALMILVQQR